MVIVLSGSRYDTFLDVVFPGMSYEPCDGRDWRELARLVHSKLPRHTCRTRHPRALQPQLKWAILEEIRGFVLDEPRQPAAA